MVGVCELGFQAGLIGISSKVGSGVDGPQWLVFVGGEQQDMQLRVVDLASTDQ